MPTGPGWVHELKWDGMRAIYTDGVFTSRTARRLSVDADPFEVPDGTVLDGELVAMRDGVPDLKALRRGGACIYIVFDLLRFEGVDLCDLPYWRRRQILSGLDLEVNPYFENGPRLLEEVLRRGLEGIVSKRLDSRYFFGRRTSNWIKTKAL